jgi:hypothetical protein
MRKSLRNRQLKRKSRKRYRGGSYYSYNKNPLRFTSYSTQIGGKMPTLNTRDTLLPQGVVNLGRNFMFNSSSNAMNGYYPLVNPDPTVQPISKSFMLL